MTADAWAMLAYLGLTGLVLVGLLGLIGLEMILEYRRDTAGRK